MSKNFRRNESFLHNLKSRPIVKKNAAQERLMKLQHNLKIGRQEQESRDSKIPISSNLKRKKTELKSNNETNNNDYPKKKSRVSPTTLKERLSKYANNEGSSCSSSQSNSSFRLSPIVSNWNMKTPETNSVAPVVVVHNEVKDHTNITFSVPSNTEVEDVEMAELPEENYEKMDSYSISEEEILSQLKQMRKNKSVNTTVPKINPNQDRSLNSLLKDYKNFEENFFVVIDTNVFLSNLKFLADLPKRNFTDAGQPILLIPYVVLQELDEIRHRSRSDSFLVKNAVNSIKYLNDRLKINDNTIKGQNAVEAKILLIDINNADDNIINYCLQVKQVTNKLILLSNDANLRNKAFLNNIEAFSRDEIDSEKSRIKFNK